MKKGKKLVPAFFQVYENDSLKNYLEHMAKKGWKLKKVDSMFLHFEACDPHRIRYCVEVMEKPSAYASNQTEKLKDYREFCRDAGWDYCGTTGYLHIFSTEEEEAIPVETDSRERYERICQACQGSNRLLTAGMGLIIIMNLYSCYMKKTFFCLNGWIALLLIGTGVWSVGEFYWWKRKAQKALKRSGTLPCIPWNRVWKKNIGIIFLILLLSILPFFYTIWQYSSGIIAWVVIGFWIYTILLAFLFTKLLSWIREKRAYSTVTNMVLYWGIALVICAVMCSGFLALVFRIL